MMKRVVTFRYGLRTLATAAAIAAALVITLSGLRMAAAAAPGDAPPAAPAAPATPAAPDTQAPAPKPKRTATPAQTGQPAAAHEKSGAHWGYEGADGPEHWGDLDPAYGTCKTGTAQSPINITTAKLAVTDLDSFHFYYKPMPLDVTDTGHSIQINFEPGCVTKVDGTPYSLVQIHFHRPSEEQINGKTFPMVAHMVHKSPDGKLAVIAVPLTIGKANPLVEAVLANLPKSAGEETKAEKTLVDPTVIMPPVRNYYTYQGSFTTPPCTEGVTWFVLKSPVTISAAQEQAFAKRYAHNARPIQLSRGRKIQSSE